MNDGAELLEHVHDFLGRFVAYPTLDAHVAHTLWCAHAHLMDAWESTPRLAFLSPEPGSGKTRALEITELLVPRPIMAVNMSPSALFRKVGDKDGLPTILFDEIDTVFGPKAKENEELRGLLNAGYRRGAKTYRSFVGGKGVGVEEIEAFCATALAGLGDLPDTILSRSVIVSMQRRRTDERIESYRRRYHAPEGEALRQRLTTWAENVSGRALSCIPEMPDGVEDRNADVWEPLLAVAELAGEEWPEHARVAAVTLVTQSRQKRESLGLRLLSDIRDVMAGVDQMMTDKLLKKLIALDESPWGDLRGKPIDARGIARRLKPYGVDPKLIRDGELVARGYKREDFWDAWNRYLQPPTASLNGAGSVTSVTDVTGDDDRVPF